MFSNEKHEMIYSETLVVAIYESTPIDLIGLKQ